MRRRKRRREREEEFKGGEKERDRASERHCVEGSGTRRFLRR